MRPHSAGGPYPQGTLAARWNERKYALATSSTRCHVDYLHRPGSYIRSVRRPTRKRIGWATLLTLGFWEECCTSSGHLTSVSASLLAPLENNQQQEESQTNHCRKWWPSTRRLSPIFLSFVSSNLERCACCISTALTFLCSMMRRCSTDEWRAENEQEAANPQQCLAETGAWQADHHSFHGRLPLTSVSGANFQ